MTIKELADAVRTRLSLEAGSRNVKLEYLNNRIMAQLISEAQQDIQRRLNVIRGSESITTTPGVNVYPLPSDFGKHKTVMNKDSVLKEISADALYRLGSSSGNPSYYAILTGDNRQTIMFYPAPSGETDITIYYYIKPSYYSPSQNADQEWGWFDGGEFSNTLRLPDEYFKAVIDYVMGQIFRDLFPYYEKEIESLRGTRAASIEDSFGYNFGGFDDVPVSIQQGSSKTVFTAADDSPDMIYRFAVTEGTEPVELYKKGYCDITVTVEETTVTVHSSGEFTPGVFIYVNNADLNYSRPDENRIVIETYPGYGSFECRLIDFEA